MCLKFHRLLENRMGVLRTIFRARGLELKRIVVVVEGNARLGKSAGRIRERITNSTERGPERDSARATDSLSAWRSGRRYAGRFSGGAGYSHTAALPWSGTGSRFRHSGGDRTAANGTPRLGILGGLGSTAASQSAVGPPHISARPRTSAPGSTPASTAPQPKLPFPDCPPGLPNVVRPRAAPPASANSTPPDDAYPRMRDDRRLLCKIPNTSGERGGYQSVDRRRIYSENMKTTGSLLPRPPLSHPKRPPSEDSLNFAGGSGQPRTTLRANSERLPHSCPRLPVAIRLLPAGPPRRVAFL